MSFRLLFPFYDYHVWFEGAFGWNVYQNSRSDLVYIWTKTKDSLLSQPSTFKEKNNENNSNDGNDNDYGDNNNLS